MTNIYLTWIWILQFDPRPICLYGGGGASTLKTALLAQFSTFFLNEGTSFYRIIQFIKAQLKQTWKEVFDIQGFLRCYRRRKKSVLF